jgi:hypothetical protein
MATASVKSIFPRALYLGKVAPIQFQKRSQLFIGAHDATLSVPIRVNNPDEKDDDGFEVERG